MGLRSYLHEAARWQYFWAPRVNMPLMVAQRVSHCDIFTGTFHGDVRASRWAGFAMPLSDSSCILNLRSCTVVAAPTHRSLGSPPHCRMWPLLSSRWPRLAEGWVFSTIRLQNRSVCPAVFLPLQLLQATHPARFTSVNRVMARRVPTVTQEETRSFLRRCACRPMVSRKLCFFRTVDRR